MLQTVTCSIRLGQFPWNDLSKGTWNVRSLLGRFTENSFKRISKVQVRFSGSVGVTWVRDGSEPAGDYTFFYRNGNENHSQRQVFCT